MNDTVVVTLPGGYWLDGVCHRHVELRPLNGADEAFLIDSGESVLPAHRTTALLARCVSRVGTSGEVTLDTIRALTVGDREALLLHLRRATLGEQMQCILTCANSHCGTKMDLELKVGTLLLTPYPHSQSLHEASLADGALVYRIRFRVPNGADVEAAAPFAATDPQGAANLILSRCVKAIADKDGKDIERLPSSLGKQLSALIAELDPQAELMLDLTCPACGFVFSALFDAATCFFHEIAGRIHHLYREVHSLAFHYHWSESEIMGMTPRKRRQYLNLLSEALVET